ncbi:hypothetical protein HMPREF0975_01052 [Actinomyces sp. oral taxon 849 str. F0330]|uniref:NUDIX hydrolase n=1 Tax=Actinomyces sp. oral taxon 849 TaxID=653385 RepID=UPI0002430585|nr:hypothetical protein HMPREF0975_01052 [Actinomyces sp. oral taxon 849 str. F0330]
MTGAPGSIDRATDRRTERTDGAGTPAVPGRLTSDGRHPVLVPEDWDQYLNASEWSLGGDGLPFRTAARVLVVTRKADMLLLVGHDAADPDHTWVFTPGGGLRPGEDPRAGAVRELAEESGIDVAPSDLEGPVAHREAVFRFATVTCRQDEIFFLLRLPARCPVDRESWTDLERDVVDSIAWWSPHDLRVAQESGREIYPVRLPALAEELAAGWSGEPIDFTDPMDADILTELTVSRPNVPSQPAQGCR